MEKNIYSKLFELKAKWITLTRDTKAFNYKYATLDQIQSKLWDFLQELKLVIVHQIKDNKVITDISEGKLIDDINDYGNFQFIDINNDSTKFIYYPTIDPSKIITEKNTDTDIIIKIIRDYFDYDTNIDNYKYMYDTKVFINDNILSYNDNYTI